MGNEQMTDRSKKIEAMYHLECLMTGDGISEEEISIRICAAHYLVQSMCDGYKPANYEKVLGDAHELDAIQATKEAIHFAKNPPNFGAQE